MANPPTARPFRQALDPSEELEFYAFVAQGAADQSPQPILLPGEAVHSYSLALSAEAVALGLRIMAGPNARGEDRTDSLTGNLLKLWFDVVPAMRGHAAFDGAGIAVGIEATFVTTQGRIWQRTVLLRIAHQ